jgi:hypothetical protein
VAILVEYGGSVESKSAAWLVFITHHGTGERERRVILADDDVAQSVKVGASNAGAQDAAIFAGSQRLCGFSRLYTASELDRLARRAANCSLCGLSWTIVPTLIWSLYNVDLLLESTIATWSEETVATLFSYEAPRCWYE